jgi:large repetitive protein
MRSISRVLTLMAASAGIAVSVASPASAAPADDLHINEILSNPEGTDAPREYVEIRGAAGSTIPANTYLVFVEASPGSGATAMGDIQNIFNLSGLTLGSNGFLVLLQGSSPWNTLVDPAATKIVGTGTGWTGVAGWSADSSATDIENESYAVFLVTAPTAPTLSGDIDVDNNRSIDTTGPGATLFNGWTVLDAVSNYESVASQATDANYTTARFLDGEWMGRPTGDPSGLAQSDWVAAGFSNGQAPPVSTYILDEAVEPASYANKVLNHLGSANFPENVEVSQFPVTPVLVGSAIGVAAIAVLGRRRRIAA